MFAEDELFDNRPIGFASGPGYHLALACRLWSASFRITYPFNPTFPRFSWYRIYDRAKAYNIHRIFIPQGRMRVNPYHRTMTWEDLESAANLIEEPKEKERIEEITNALAKSTLRGELSAHWFLPLDEISYLDSERDYFNADSIQDGSRHPA